MSLRARLLRRLVRSRRGFLVVSKAGDVLLERFRLFDRRLFGVYIHRCVGPDLDPLVYHDHPWSWSASLVLVGSYVEERPGFGEDPIRRECRTGNINYLSRNTFHRLAAISKGGAWTLYIRARRVKEDGFLVVGEHGRLQHLLAEDVDLETKVAFDSIDTAEKS